MHDLHDVFFVDEAHNKVIKNERLQNKDSLFGSIAEKTSSSTRTQQSFTSGDQPPANKATDAPTINPVTTITPTIKDKENSYAMPGVSKCYRYVNLDISPMSIQGGGKSMWQSEDEDEVKIETELEDSDIAEEYGESATCMVQRLLCNQKASDTTQQHQIFYSRCSVKK